ncbi:LegC family aminotransferase [Siphonobacter sp. SORGH_AS_1065]|uniref:LegC family aminotransferase n=1 Tax=Siphonobacter sp. SORGH_AS_1065 TaxID=3041795 RepID=UPI00277DDA6B|nr:LegC family aminotransferase [Siphonobacter sp. SORGH_AS_1065]MDQ1086425.1 perosamine synthetase [Siphonobacter sp. SORGH_AS_1065]
MNSIPLCEPNLAGNEWTYVKESLDSNWLSGGSYLRAFEKSMCEYTGAVYAIGVSSGTSALHIALLVNKIEKNDLVIVPNLTFIATANAVTYVGAEPLLIDIDSKTWLLDLDVLDEFLTTQTYQKNNYCYYHKSKQRIKAIVLVHLLGNMPDMERLLSLTQRYNIELIEDAAGSLGSFYKGKHAGTFGSVGTFSFNSNKIITTAGGGMVITDDALIAQQVKHLITQAKTGTIEYLHDQIGYNYRLVNPLAAIGLAQMEYLNSFVTKKQKIAAYYTQELSTIPNLGFQTISPGVNSNFWHFVITVPNSRKLIQYLAEFKIETRPLWIPIQELPAFKNNVYISKNHTTAGVANKGIMLPCSTSITQEQLAFVVKKIKSFYL